MTAIHPVRMIQSAGHLLARYRFVAWIAWAGILLPVYYKQIFPIFAMPLQEWIDDNYSLYAFREMFLTLAGAGISGWSLATVGEAFTRMGMALLGAGAICLTAFMVGRILWSYLRLHSATRIERILYQSALGFALISQLLLGLAFAGIFRPTAVVILIGLLMGISVIFLRAELSIPVWRQRLAQLAVDGRRLAGQDRILKGIVALALTIGLIGALAPETEFDALWYHLWLPKLWLEAGRPVDLVTEYVSLYPLGWDLLFGAGMVMGGPVAAKLLHFITLPLTALFVLQLSRRFFPRASSWLAVALFVSAPTVLWQATTTYIDLALAFYVGLAVYAAVRYVQAQKWQWLALAAVTLGFALVIKHLALFVLVLIALALFFYRWRQHRRWLAALVPVVILGSVSLLFPLPYYIRAWLAAGNPFFPDLYGIFGAFPAERWSAITEYGLSEFKSRFGYPLTASTLLALPWTMTVDGARFGGALGPLFLLLMPVLILWWRNDQRRPLLAFVVGYIALWSSPVSSFQLRFLLPIVAFLAVLAAEGYRALADATGAVQWRTRILGWGMAALIFLNLPPFLSLHENARVEWDGWLTHVIHEIPLGVVIGFESEESYLQRTVPSYRAWQFINAQLPVDAHILTFSSGDHFYSERKRLSDDSTMARPVTWGAPQGKEDQALATLQRMGISHILFDKRLLARYRADTFAIAGSDFIDQWYVLEYEDHRFVLYRLQETP
ncbi:MAG: glycosyltransferase family 39 protein [Caldilineaceae bacterium]|nr:glycosyltransferase family 39 protein [Caldilineaceae bacterium]